MTLTQELLIVLTPNACVMSLTLSGFHGSQSTNSNILKLLI